MNNLEIKNTNIGQIHGYERNARNHPESQIKQIRKSITEFGFNNPILIDEHGEIIAGHGRYIAAKQMGLSTVPTITLSHLNEKQKRAYRLADNKIAENGGWNLELLQLEIKDLEQICAGDLDIRITGFNDAELDQIINLGDTVPADPKANHIPFISEDEIVSVLGDIWQIGPHRIICGNSLEESTFNQLMDGAVADTVLQDPPYNVKINGHVCGSGAIHHKEFAMASGEMSAEEFINFLKQNFFLQRRELVRVMIDRAIYSQEKLIFHINTNPQLFNAFLSEYHINQNANPMEYSVNGDTVTIVRPIVLRRYANTRFHNSVNGLITITENYHLILKAFATAWRYREMYEQGGDVDTIGRAEHVALRHVYKHLSLSYLNPEIVNHILSNQSQISVRDMLDKASRSNDFSEQKKLFTTYL